MTMRGSGSGKRNTELPGWFDLIPEIFVSLVLFVSACSLGFFVFQYAISSTESYETAERYTETINEPFEISIWSNLDGEISGTDVNDEVNGSVAEGSPAAISEAEALNYLKSLDRIAVDEEALKAENRSYCGWVTVPGTRISYPVYRSADNQDMLHSRPDGSYLYAGSIFMDAFVPDKEHDGIIRNLIIYGHNMISGSMFAGLHGYAGLDFYNSHPFIIYKPYGELTEFYRVYSSFQVPAESAERDVLLPAVAEEGFYEYTDRMKSMSLYDTDVVIHNELQLMTLSTCIGDSRENRRFIVCGIRQAVGN